MYTVLVKPESQSHARNILNIKIKKLHLLDIGNVIFSGNKSEQGRSTFGVRAVKFGQRLCVILLDGTSGLEVEAQIVKQFEVSGMCQREPGTLL